MAKTFFQGKTLTLASIMNNFSSGKLAGIKSNGVEVAVDIRLLQYSPNGKLGSISCNNTAGGGVENTQARGRAKGCLELIKGLGLTIVPLERGNFLARGLVGRTKKVRQRLGNLSKIAANRL